MTHCSLFEKYLFPVSRSPHPGFILSFSRNKDFFLATDHEFISRSNGLSENIVQDRPTTSLFDRRNIICVSIRGNRSWSWRISSNKSKIELTLSHRLCCCLKFFFGFTRKSDDNIGRDRKQWIARTQILHLRPKIRIGMFAIHFLEHGITARLKCKMQVRTQMLEVKMRIENITSHVMRIRTRKPNTIESCYSVNLFQEFTKWCLHLSTRPSKFLRIPEFRTRFFSIAIHILSEKSHFFRSCLYHCLDFMHNRIHISRNLPSARMGYDTECTKIIASRLNNHIRTRRTFLELFHGKIFIEFCIIANILSCDGRKNFRKQWDFLDPKYEINKRRAEKEGIIIIRNAFYSIQKSNFRRTMTLDFSLIFPEIPSRHPRFSYHTARNPKEWMHRCLMVLMESGNFIHKSKHAILPFLAYRTGIQDNHIRLHGIDHFSHSRRKKDHIDLLRISIIHLTTEGFDVEGFEHKKFFTSNTWRVYRENHFCKPIMSTKCVYEMWLGYENLLQLQQLGLHLPRLKYRDRWDKIKGI